MDAAKPLHSSDLLGGKRISREPTASARADNAPQEGTSFAKLLEQRASTKETKSTETRPSQTEQAAAPTTDVAFETDEPGDAPPENLPEAAPAEPIDPPIQATLPEPSVEILNTKATPVEPGEAAVGELPIDQAPLPENGIHVTELPPSVGGSEIETSRDQAAVSKSGDLPDLNLSNQTDSQPVEGVNQRLGPPVEPTAPSSQTAETFTNQTPNGTNGVNSTSAPEEVAGPRPAEAPANGLKHDFAPQEVQVPIKAIEASPAIQSEVAPVVDANPARGQNRQSATITPPINNDFVQERFVNPVSPIESGVHGTSLQTAESGQIPAVIASADSVSAEITGPLPLANSETEAAPATVAIAGQTENSQPTTEHGAPATAAASRIETAALPSGDSRTEANVPVRIAEATLDRIGTAISETQPGGRAIRMRLQPPELGVLQIEVVSQEGALTARLTVENASAHRAISESLAHLQETLHRVSGSVERIELNFSEPQSAQSGGSENSHAFDADRRDFGDPISETGEPENPDLLSGEEPPEDTTVPRQTARPREWLRGIDLQV